MAVLPIEEIQADVAAVFLSYFQRAPEFEAMQWYAQVYEDLLAAQGDNPAAEENAFKALAAQIYADGVGSNEVPAGPTVTNAWYVEYLYQNVLGRPADEDGFEYWVSQLDEGNIERAELVGILIAAAVDGGGRDAAFLENRVEVAVEFSLWENSNPQVLPTLKYNAAEVLIGVNEDPATVAAAQARLNEATGREGDTFTLTPGIDTFEGTSYNDVFNAFSVNPATGANATTVNPFDLLDGDAGWDTLNVYASEGEFNVEQRGTVRNIEVVNLFSDGEGWVYDPNHSFMGSVLGDLEIPALNAGRYEGVRELWQIGMANPLIDNVGDDTVLGYRNISGLGELPLLVSIANHRADATSADMAFENVGNPELGLGGLLVAAGESLDTWNLYGDPDDNGLMLGVMVAGDGVETVNINSELDMMLLYTASHDVLDTILAILEDGAEDLPEAVDAMLAANTVTTLDASGSTGDLDALVSGSVDTVIGGSGDDAFVFLGPLTDEFLPGLFASLDLFMDVDGGDGYDSAFVVNSTFQTQDYDAINQMQNIEELGFLNPDVVVDAGQVADYDYLLFGGLASLMADLGELEVGLIGDLEFGSSDMAGERLDDCGCLSIYANVENLQASQTLIIAEMSDTIIDLTNAAADVTVESEWGAWLDLYVDTSSADTIGAKGGTLTLMGEGEVYYGNDSGYSLADETWTNGDNGKFAEIDASELEGTLFLGWVGDGFEIADEGVYYGGLSGSVAEEVYLGSGDSFIVLQAGIGEFEGTQSSSLGMMDTIYNFDSEFDTLVGGVDGMMPRVALPEPEAYTTDLLELGAGTSTLQQAFAEAAAAYEEEGVDVLYFHFEGDTYLYADTVDPGAGRYDNGDFGLRIVGEHEIEFSSSIFPVS